MNLKDIHKSKTVRVILISIGIAIIALSIFRLGTFVGYHRARFSEHLGNNFQKNFVDPRGGFFKGSMDRMMPPGGHGTAGEIVSVDSSLIVVAGSDKLEKTVIISKDTLIRKFRDDAGGSDLKPGDFIVVLGNPNDEGQIVARLIRIIPPPKSFSNSEQSK